MKTFELVNQDNISMDNKAGDLRGLSIQGSLLDKLLQEP